jgi:hypothetical protein
VVHLQIAEALQPVLAPPGEVELAAHRGDGDRRVVGHLQVADEVRVVTRGAQVRRHDDPLRTLRAGVVVDRRAVDLGREQLRGRAPRGKPADDVAVDVAGEARSTLTDEAERRHVE